jgi:ribose transport system substrate-binding protein
VDQAVTEPSAYVISNNQEEYAYLGAKWLFEQLGGEGDVVYMRGAAGASADDDRHRGFQRALEEQPGINVVQEVFTGWQQDQGKQQILDLIASGIPFDGVWTSGIDNVIVDAMVESEVPLVPVVGADNAGFVGQLVNVEGLEGAAVTNPGSIGGAGVALALQILQGQAPAERTVLVTPRSGTTCPRKARASSPRPKAPTSTPSGPCRCPSPAGPPTTCPRSSPAPVPASDARGGPRHHAGGGPCLGILHGHPPPCSTPRASRSASAPSRRCATRGSRSAAARSWR